MPAMKRARQQAKNTVCQSNLRQWGIIFTMFWEDNNYRTIGGNNNPEAEILGAGTPGAEAWPQILHPYYQDKDVRFCAETQKNDGQAYGDIHTAWNYGWYRGIEYAGSYGINDWVYSGSSSTWGISVVDRNFKHPDAKNANNIPLFLDCVHIGSVPFHTDAPPQYDSLPYYHHSLMGRYSMNRHGNGTINCLFLDSSVRSVGLKELWTLKWHREFDTSGPWTRAGGVEPWDWPEWMDDFTDY
jgi:prepilin-type processing-associated H-X9-DG protein